MGIEQITVFALLFLSFCLAKGDYCFGPRMRACRDGHCIASDFFCNGENDCGDWTDEFNCDSPMESDTKLCPANTFLCGQQDQKCIPWSWICDGMPDCINGRDEANCTNLNECKAGFRCGRECILKSWVCDGTEDCMDGSDEKDCALVEFKKPLETIVLTDELARMAGVRKNTESAPQNSMVYTRQTDELVPYVVETIQAAVERVLEALNNPCSSNPCSNGVCSAQNSTTYVCQCPQGFKVASLEPFKCEWAYTGKKVNG